MISNNRIKVKSVFDDIHAVTQEQQSVLQEVQRALASTTTDLNFEISNLEVVEAVVREFHGPDANVQDYINTNYERPGADLRYSIDGEKLKNLGFESKRDFYTEIPSIVQYHKDNWIW